MTVLQQELVFALTAIVALVFPENLCSSTEYHKTLHNCTWPCHELTSAAPF